MMLQHRGPPSSPPRNSIGTYPSSNGYRPSSTVRTGDSQRPPIGPRSSSLTLPSESNFSHHKLNPNIGNISGSSLRREIFPRKENPIDVLENLVGLPEKDSSLLTGDNNDEAEGLFGTSSLEEFATQVEAELGNNGEELLSNATSAYDDIITFDGLHESILKCDRVLQAVEVSLSKFEGDLGTVSLEIENLQKRSLMINGRLERRKSVEHMIGPSADELSIPPATVVTLSEGPNDQEWSAGLLLLTKRLRAMSQTNSELESRPADSDLRPLLENLQNIAVERGRDFFVAQIKGLRSPHTNAQHVQQRNFLPHKDLLCFMSQHQPTLTAEIMQAYALTMRWYYSHNFASYMQTLEKLSLWSVDRSDAIGVDFSSQKSQKSRPLANPKSTATLSLGRRHVILAQQNAIALPAHAALEMKSAVHLETPFHAFATAIADNAATEYAFLASFLSPSTLVVNLPILFSTIFTPVFEMAQTFTKKLVGDTTDCLALLLCIRTTQQQAFFLQRRKCPGADGWINRTNMLLWPKFQNAMDIHVESVKRMTENASPSLRASTSLISSKGDGTVNISPHPISQRYAQLVHGILTLSNIPLRPTDAQKGPMTDDSAILGSDVEPVGQSLDRLRNEVDLFLRKIAGAVGPSRKNRFLANNYSLIMTIIGDTKGKLAHEQQQWLRDKLEETSGL